MKNMNIEKAERVILFVDFQERLIPAIAEVDALVDKTVRLAKGAAVLDLPILVTEQYKKGLGATIEPINAAFDGKAKYFEKTAFSAAREEGFVEFLEAEGKGIKEIVICGIESHICVTQTALDLVELGYKVYVAEDCVSSRNLNDKAVAVRRMRDAGVIATTVESVLFEVMLHAKAEAFKEVSKIIK